MHIGLIAFLIALGIAVIAAVLSAVSSRLGSYKSRDVLSSGASAALSGISCLVLIFFLDLAILYYDRPAMIEGRIWGMIALDMLIATAVCVIADLIDSEGYRVGLASIASVSLTAVFMVHVLWVSNTAITEDTAAKKVAHLVSVTTEDPSKIPETDANHMVIVPDKAAAYKAGQALSSGAAGKQNLNTYFNVGGATLESVGGHMYYVFQLTFDGSGNKHKQHNIVPGYLMVDAENPDAEPIQRIGKSNDGRVDYSMKVSIDGGQDEDLARYVYTHGYSGYEVDDPTLEVADDGHPYFTATLLRPAVKWSRWYPVGMVVVDANNGAITRYPVNGAPDWVDRVYSAHIVTDMMNWWGDYANRTYKMTNTTNANRFKVSGDPQLVYTKGGHPQWRMLMSSYNSDTSVNYIVLFDGRSNTVKLYTPQEPIGTEDSVVHSFESASAVKSSGYKAAGLTLHVIYGRLTWVVSYISEGDNGKASFQGIGLLDAYDVNGAGVIFGKSKSDALAAYQSQIAGGSNNNAPPESGRGDAITGKIVNRTEVVEGGQTFVYLVLSGDLTHVYRGKAGADSPELIFSKPGDSVVLNFLNVGDDAKVRNVSAFDDQQLQFTN